MKVLVINCGSSSLKFQLIDVESEEVIVKGICDRIAIEGSRFVFSALNKETIDSKIELKDHADAMKIILNTLTDHKNGVIHSLSEIAAVGHRVVHGGERFASSVIINEDVIRAIEECSDLAPLHNKANLTGIQACKKMMPETPMVAVFDTAFHQTMPEEAYLYGIPYEYYEKYKVRKYGFHGTSHAYVAQRASVLLKQDLKALKLIVCHLGNGASVTAVKYGKSIDTSMGLTPLEGLIMGTRSGDIDPSVLGYIGNKENKGLEELMKMLNHDSGLLGLSGGESSDFRDIVSAYEKNDERAVRALKAFAYRTAKYIGSYAAAMNGVDGICFTAGIGENSGLVREMICNYLSYLGLELDSEKNEKRGMEQIITTLDSKVRVMVIPTNEELMIARETYRELSAADKKIVS
ncbi:MAG: acetate kinase [Lachnospiraceae bacterium]|nr:acetate kinase [Lachnospiraceae bacterium]MDD3659160.1 acetate kinase [Lachnospiraceae bacterium]